MSDTRIQLPHDWNPRPHQLSLWYRMTHGCKRGLAVWHRRAGKDSTALNFTAVQMHKRVGMYWHMLPEASQGRKVVWDGIDKDGRRMIDQAFPESLRKPGKTNVNEMKIEMLNGSIWQVVGSDNYNSLLGGNPVGIVLSEYSVSNPSAWDYLRPILAENGGWALFLYTPRGKNHGYKLFKSAQKLMEKDGSWFAECLTVNDTLVIAPEVIQGERDSGMDDDMVQQEYFCSWEGVQQGSIYGDQLQKMRAQGRIGSVPYDRRYPVNTFWDIGHRDTTAIIAHQVVGAQDRYLRSYEASGQDTAHFYGILAGWAQDHGYLYGEHYLPHDAKNVTLAAKSHPLGKNVWDQMTALGMRNLRMVPRVPEVWTAINATRMRMSTLYIDAEGCEKLIDALESYHKKYDDERKCFRQEPDHDWASNFADAHRGWGTGFTAQGQGGVYTLPSALPTKVRQMPQVPTIGSSRAGY